MEDDRGPSRGLKSFFGNFQTDTAEGENFARDSPLCKTWSSP